MREITILVYSMLKKVDIPKQEIKKKLKQKFKKKSINITNSEINNQNI